MTEHRAQHALRAGLTLACCLLAVGIADAQPPELPEVPTELHGQLKTKLDGERHRVVVAEGKLRTAWAEHAKDCTGVEAGSPAQAACVARRDTLVASANAVRDLKSQFRTALRDAITAEVNRLSEEEAALSNSIETQLGELRAVLVESATPSIGALTALTTELAKSVEQLKRKQRVRRTLGILAVRG